MATAGSGTGTTSMALLFSFSAVVFLFLLLHSPATSLAVADLLASALDRLLGGRGLMELATRRNTILLCHAILFLILRDAGVLAGARRRSPPGEATATNTAAAVVAAQTVPARRPHATRSAGVVALAASSSAGPVPAQPYATRSTVVWKNRPVVAPMHEHDVVVECRPEAAELAAATWAVPVLATAGPPAQAATKLTVLAESSPRNDVDGLLDRRDCAAVVVEPLEPPAAIAEDGESDDRRIVAADEKRGTDDDTAREQPTEVGMEIELADDRTFDEFIESQRRKMRQESLQLLRSASAYHYQYQAIATC